MPGSLLDRFADLAYLRDRARIACETTAREIKRFEEIGGRFGDEACRLRLHGGVLEAGEN